MAVEVGARCTRLSPVSSAHRGPTPCNDRRSNLFGKRVRTSLLAPSLRRSDARRRLELSASSECRVFDGNLTASSGARFGIVVAKFNELVTKALLEGAVGGFKRFGVDPAHIDIVWVPGSFEIPMMAKAMSKSGKYQSVVCIGAVIRGSTSHYDAVVSGVTSGVLSASLDTGVPVIFGVLTCDDMNQALDRAGGKLGNKGYEFAVSALETTNTLDLLKADESAISNWGTESPPT